MSTKKIVEFPEVEAKLQKPSKQSAFEKQRAEAEAKKAREKAETEAVLKEFQESFDNDDNQGGYGGNSRLGSSANQDGFPPRGPAFGGGGGGGGASRRHFGASNLKSGPGSLGPTPVLKSGPGSLGPVPTLYGKKRGFDAFREDRQRDNRAGGEDKGEPMSVSKAFNHSDDEEDAGTDARIEEQAVARPTLRLSQIPPGTSPATIKSLITPSLTVENVKIVPANGPSSERKCTVAIVTLSQETPATDIDAAVSSLQNRYLGYGFYLSLHRHLSSAVTSSISTSSLGASTSAGSQPFSAKPVASQKTRGNASTQQAFHRGFAPPTAYGPPAGGSLNRSSILHVPVKPPNDIKMLQLINKTIESLLAHGPEFEALLMTRPEVQKEEKWAWVWDARSEGGIWYRWRLWEIVTGSSSQSNKGKYLPLFDGSHAWKAPDKRLAFEYTTRLDEFVSDSEYNSSDEDDEEEAGREQQNKGAEVESTFLNPLDKAKLTHLLSRLPTTLSRVRKGDVARVTTFALTHASRGADEVVDMIVSNVERPFALTTANPDHQRDGRGRSRQQQQGEVSEASDGGEAEADDKTDKEGQDNSAASLVGLYVVSDILSSSSASGIRHAWRFRQILEGALKERRVFETLGLMAEKLNWGRLKAEKWKRSVGMVLNLWEGWCVFPAESQELFSSSFDNPPSLKAREQADSEPKNLGGRWKVVKAATPSDAPGVGEANDDAQGEPMEEEEVVVGVPMDEDDDVVGEPIEDDEGDDDVAGEPMEEEDVEGEPMSDDEDMIPAAAATAPDEAKVEGNLKAASTAADGGSSAYTSSTSSHAATRTAGPGHTAHTAAKAAGQGRRRMRAVDMFADSGESDGGN